MKHTVDEALERFALVSGAGDGEKTACAMSMLNWIWQNSEAGWTDSPQCAHQTIRSVVIRANDDAGTTAEDRAELVRLGEHGVLDTWWVPVNVIIFYLSRPEGTEPLSALAAAKVLLKKIAEWKNTHEVPDLYRVNLYRANLSRANLWTARYIEECLNLDKAFSVSVKP